MPKFFVLSDIHGFYDQMIKALDDAGFDKNNENHWLITCGDHFDRGPEPIKVMRYLEGLPRKVLVKGNHEQLMVDLCERGFPYSYDRSNGTLYTAYEFDFTSEDLYNINYDLVLQRVKPFFDSMVNYFETKNHIFVHSWIPVISQNSMFHKFKENWRNSTEKEWNDAMWCHPYELADKGLTPDKTIVFGHWHCSTGWANAENRSEFGEDAKFDTYYGDGFISIDACTAYSGKCNVLVIDDDFLEG